MEFQVYNTPWTADWLAHATQRTLTDSTQDGTVCTEYSSREPSGRLWKLLSLSLHPPPRCVPLPPRNKLLSETIHSDYLIAKCLDSGCFPRGVGFYVYIFVLVYLLFFFFWLKKKRKKTNITVLKYCLTYSISLCSVCAQDWAELTSASFCLEWGAGRRGVGGAR